MTNRQARRFHKAFSRHQQQYEKAAAKAFHAALRGQVRQFVEEAHKHPAGMELQALKLIPELPLAKVYRRVCMRIAVGYEKITEEEITAEETGGKATTPRMQAKAVGDPNDAEMVEAYLRLHGAQKVVGITERTRKWIAEQVVQGQRDGLTFAQIAKGLVTNDISAMRAMRIARTESVAMMNLGRYLAANKSNFQKEKIWVSSHDKRVRPGITSPNSPYDHHDADIREVDLEEAFQVSEEKLMFPGDTSLGASAGNVINCRCSFALQTKRDENGRMLVKPKPMTVTATGFENFPEGELIVLPAPPKVGLGTLIEQLLAAARLGPLLGLTFLQLFQDENQNEQ